MKSPYDAGFKILAEDHPELLLRLLGIVAPGKKTQVTNVLRELRLDPVQIDHAYMLDDATIVHFEAFTSWDPGRIGRLALYHFLLREKYHILTIISHVVMMAEKYAPKNLPERLVYEEADGLRLEIPYKVIRLWEIDPAAAFEPEGEPLLPWVPLLKGGTAEFERAAQAIEQLVEHPKPPYEPRVLMSYLATMASLRYDKKAVKEFLQRLERKIMISIDAFKVSWLYQEGLEEGEAKGEAKGRAEGAATSLRSALRRTLASKFPAEEFPEIDQAHPPETLDRLLQAALEAKTPDDARAAILAVVRPQ